MWVEVSTIHLVQRSTTRDIPPPRVTCITPRLGGSMLRTHPRRLVALVVATLAVPLLTPEPAHAAPPSYVALGDSYSSGVGTRTYLPDGTSCQRSVYAFPSLIAAAKGYTLNLRACSGAKVSDVTATQLSA